MLNQNGMGKVFKIGKQTPKDMCLNWSEGEYTCNRFSSISTSSFGVMES